MGEGVSSVNVFMVNMNATTRLQGSEVNEINHGLQNNDVIEYMVKAMSSEKTGSRHVKGTCIISYRRVLKLVDPTILNLKHEMI